MKRNCFHLKFILMITLLMLGFNLIGAQLSNDTVYISNSFKEINLKNHVIINGEGEIKGTNHFYFGFEKNINLISFNLKNTSNQEKSLILELSNALINEVVLIKENKQAKPLAITGIDYPKTSKPIQNRLFVFNLKLKPQEVVTYMLQLKKEKGKPLVTSILLKDEGLFYRQSSIQMTFIGIYYGISLLSVLFSLFVFFFLKKYSYVIYGLYIIFLGLFISSYTGLYSLFFLSDENVFDKYTNYVLFSEISLLLFIVFSQKILEAKKYMPKLKKAIDIMLVALISVRLVIHFFLTELFNQYVSIFMKLWYSIFLTMIVLISIEIVKYFKTNLKRTSLFAIAYIFMISGVCLTILYHGYGLFNTMLYGLPLIFYSSFLEILFLTFMVIYMVKDIYEDRNILSEKLVLEEKKNLYSFIKGEDNERKRISRELHDNIGSKLSYLKRFVEDKINNHAINEALDAICNDVRNLSHEISPSDLKLVGLEIAIADLSKKLNDQTSLSVSFGSYQFPIDIEENHALQIYRAVQEIFSNTLKHSSAKHLEVQLIGHNNHAVITIEDDGVGFNTKDDYSGHGLKNIILRINQIGGTVEIDSKLNQGSSFIISFPN